MGFPRPEYWSGLPFLSPMDLPYPGIKPTSSALTGDSLPLSHQRSPHREKAYKNHARGNKWHCRCCGSEQSARQCRRPKRSRRHRWIRGREDPRRGGMVTHSSILARRIPRTVEPPGRAAKQLDRPEHAHVVLALGGNWFCYQLKIFRKIK